MRRGGVAALMVGAVLGAAEAQQAPAAPRSSRTLTVRVDTGDGPKVVVVMEGLDSLMRALARSRALEERIGMALRDYSASEENVVRRRALEEQLQKIVESNVRLMSKIQIACTQRKTGDRTPEGYLGVAFNISGSVKREGSGAEVYRFDEPPEIVTVETGSPADKAGIRRGDRLVALDGRELVGRDVVLAQYLVPGRKLAARVGRDGREENVVVLVQKRPEGFGDECTDLDISMGPTRGAMSVVRPEGRAFTMVRPSVPRTPAPSAAPAAPEAPRAPSVWTFDAPPPVAISGFSAIVAGAQLTALTDDFKELTGADAGLMVQRVLPETPAASAGLKGGDVIVEAGDRPVMSAGVLARRIGESDERTLKLKVVRKGKARTVWLKW